MTSRRSNKTQTDRLNSKWVQGLTEEEAESFVQKYKNSKEVLLKLRKILEEEIHRSYIEEESLESTTHEELVKIIGYRKGLRKTLNYLPEG